MSKITSNIKQVIKGLNDFEKKQVPYATSKAINDTAFKVKDELVSQMKQKLDKPTPFTLRAVKIKKSNKRTLTAEIYIDDIQADYLKRVYKGGTKMPKKKALVIPTKDIRLNKYGNLTKSKVKNLLSSGNYFEGKVKGKGGERAGIFRKYKNGRIKQVIAWADSKEDKKLLEFDGVVKSVVKENMDDMFRRALKYAISTAK